MTLDEDHPSMPERYTSSLGNSPSFLGITGHIITLWIIILSVVSLMLITLLFKHQSVRKIGQRTKSYMIYNGVIKLILAST